MTERLLVQIPVGQVEKLEEIRQIRKDLSAFPDSKIIHTLVQERMAQVLNESTFSVEEKWVEYIRERIPLHVFAPIVLGMIRHSQEMIGTSFTKIMVLNEADNLIWCELKNDLETIGAFLEENLAKTDFFDSYFKRYREICSDLDKHSQELKEKKWEDLSDEELHSTYATFYSSLKKFHGLTMDIDAADLWFEKRIRKKIEQLSKKQGADTTPNIINEKYSILTTPYETSYLNKEEKWLAEIAQQIKENPDLTSLFSLDSSIIVKKLAAYPELFTQIKLLTEKYWWTNLGWASGEEKTLTTFIKAIKSTNSPVELIKHYYLELAKLSENKQKIRQELLFDGEMDSYLKILEEYAFLHDLRKELQMKTTFIMNQMLIDIARRSNQKYEDLRWCWPTEVMDCLLTYELPPEVQRRKETYMYYVTENNVLELFGDAALKKKKEELNVITEEINDFQGAVACRGKVAGVAKVCYSPREAIEKIKEGDILITSMTTPDYILAMKKAAAIVTNEGGITCHAAIVSRELNIPCLVGTKIATKVINDGDTIEVNANHGRVKILKRKT